MLKSKVALATLLGLVISGCSSDEPGIDIAQADSINIEAIAFDAENSSVNFKLVDDQGELLNGAEKSQFLVAFMGLPEKTEMKGMAFPWHQTESFGCDEEDCNVQLTATGPGEYQFAAPQGIEWQPQVVYHRVALQVRTGSVESTFEIISE
ncbi:hypothetical protein [Paraferrimonas sedimenticola]|uniref:Lipoprotein n=1 Tax=Paraferrimonas sedimenticola TaxID=375674 RepID=A0AA37RXN3_9GAMM|nr:hypothetical protein [Paraferrimonas sedimenticola]GLP97051.1 hypothetical protein GCM10007895_23570 [Paraferrimonas sedimenticola]